MVWCSSIGMACMVWYGIAALVWYGVAALVWYGVVALAWYGMVGYSSIGMAWYTTPYHTIPMLLYHTHCRMFHFPYPGLVHVINNCHQLKYMKSLKGKNVYLFIYQTIVICNNYTLSYVPN